MIFTYSNKVDIKSAQYTNIVLRVIVSGEPFMLTPILLPLLQCRKF